MYTPNEANKLVVLIGSVENTRDRLIAAGCNQIALARDWILKPIDAGTASFDVCLIYNLQPAGIIVNAPASPLLEAIHKMAVPAVATAQDEVGATGSVELDDEAIGAMAAEHLLERGFTSLAGFGISQFAFSRRRLEGFANRVMQNAGCSFDPGKDSWTPRIHEGPFTHHRRGDPGPPPPAFVSWLKELPKPVGIFAPADNWGLNLIHACRMIGLRVPEDVAVVGADNHEAICELSRPPLSSVEIPWRQVGQLAGEMLAELMDNPSSPRERRRRRVKPLGVVTRRSSDTVAVDDPEVAAALAMIHEHAGSPLSVRQILCHVPAYQHRLERGFKRHVGRSMLAEIRRVHVNQAKRLLRLTDMSMPEVARRSGFTSYKRMGEAFLAETKLTPRDYRASISQESSG